MVHPEFHSIFMRKPDWKQPACMLWGVHRRGFGLPDRGAYFLADSILLATVLCMYCAWTRIVHEACVVLRLPNPLVHRPPRPSTVSCVMHWHTDGVRTIDEPWNALYQRRPCVAMTEPISSPASWVQSSCAGGVAPAMQRVTRHPTLVGTSAKTYLQLYQNL